MIHDEYFDDLAIHYVCARDPYDLDEHLTATRRALTDARDGGYSWSMTFVDMTGVNLLLQSEATFRRFIRRRQEMGIATAPKHMAVQVGDIGSYGMMRMYGMLAEMGGIRNEADYFVSMSLAEVAAWMETRLKRGPLPGLEARFSEAAARAARAFDSA